MEQWRKVAGFLLTGGFVFRVCFDCAFSSSDSDALERRLGSGLLLRHPQVSNQNSKVADTNQSDEKWSIPVLGENLYFDPKTLVLPLLVYSL